MNYKVTILILIDGFLQYENGFAMVRVKNVTILILIDGFLQYNWWKQIKTHVECHNPYFNRWFSAIKNS